LYTFGSGSRYFKVVLGGLGHGSRNDELSPKLVESLSNKKIIDVSCGNY
jgi:hypothetical protein